MPYATPADVAAYLETTLTTEQQAKVTGLIAGIESLINRFCNRSWSNGTSQTEHFDGGTSRLFPKHVPIDAVSSLKLDDTALAEGEDFYIYDTYIALDSIPTRGRKRLTLVYTADDTLPDALKQVVIRWAAEQFVGSNRTQTSQVKRLTQGPVTLEYDTAKNTINPKSGLPQYVEEAVASYRLPAI